MSGFIVQGGILDFLTSSGGKLDLFLKITLTPGTTAFYRPSPPNRTNLNARPEEYKPHTISCHRRKEIRTRVLGCERREGS